MQNIIAIDASHLSIGLWSYGKSKKVLDGCSLNESFVSIRCRQYRGTQVPLHALIDDVCEHSVVDAVDMLRYCDDVSWDLRDNWIMWTGASLWFEIWVGHGSWFEH